MSEVATEHAAVHAGTPAAWCRDNKMQGAKSFTTDLENASYVSKGACAWGWSWSVVHQTVFQTQPVGSESMEHISHYPCKVCMHHSLADSAGACKKGISVISLWKCWLHTPRCGAHSHHHGQAGCCWPSNQCNMRKASTYVRQDFAVQSVCRWYKKVV